MQSKTLMLAGSLVVALAISGQSLGKVAEEEAAELGKSLTPLGGEKAANADGSIPEWSGKWEGLPPGLSYDGPGSKQPDPYADEKPLFSITPENFQDYKENLSDGQIALFRTAKGSLIKIMVTLNTRRPEEHRYRLFGVDGSAEWFGYEQFARRLTRSQETRDGWERIPIGYAAVDDDTTTGHGGADSKVARAFIDSVKASTTAWLRVPTPRPPGRR